MHRLKAVKEDVHIPSKKKGMPFTIDVSRKNLPAANNPRINLVFDRLSFINPTTKLHQLIGNSRTQPASSNSYRNLFKSFALKRPATNKEPLRNNEAPLKTLIRRTKSQHRIMGLPIDRGVRVKISPMPWLNLRAFSVEQRKPKESQRSHEVTLIRPLTQRGTIKDKSEERIKVETVVRPSSYTCNMTSRSSIRRKTRLPKQLQKNMLNELGISKFPFATVATEPPAENKTLQQDNNRMLLTITDMTPPAKPEKEKYFIRIRCRLEKLWSAILRMKRMKLTPSEISNKTIFSSIPYEHKNSKEFFISVKMGDVSSVQGFLKLNRYLVFDFDPVRQTALHWAVKRQHLEIADLLLKHGADVDAVDIMGRTALFLAARRNFVDMIKLLISHQADPFQGTKKGETPHEVTTNHYIKLYIKKAQQVSVLMKWASPMRRIELWKKWMYYIFYDPLCKPTDVMAELAKMWSQ